MGSGVAAAFVRAGFDVITDLSDRSAHSRALAAAAGTRDVGSIAAIVQSADVLLSIVPPAAAADFAEAALRAMLDTGRAPIFAECNAISPDKMRKVAEPFEAAGRICIDVGIVGRPPGRDDGLATRFYVAGPARRRLLDLDVAGIHCIDMGEEIGAASAIKMVYASLNKGIDALMTAVLLAAESLGVRSKLLEELGRSQTVVLSRMEKRIPYLAATAERFAPEMREIAATFEAAGVTPAFHEGAAWLYEGLAKTPLAAETRATLPAQRSLEEAIEIFSAVIERTVRK